jgi:hypothetical protein
MFGPRKDGWRERVKERSFLDRVIYLRMRVEDLRGRTFLIQVTGTTKTAKQR